MGRLRMYRPWEAELEMGGLWGVRGVPGVRLVDMDEGWRVLFDPTVDEEECCAELGSRAYFRDLLQGSGLSRQLFRTRRDSLEALEGLLAVNDAHPAL